MRAGAIERGRGYVLAVGAAAAAVFLRWLLHPWLGEHLALVTLPAAVAASVWYGGWRPAVLATVLGYVGCDLFFIGEGTALSLSTAPELLGLLGYLLSSGIIIGLGEAMRVARRRVERRQAVLWVTLASIGDAVITTDTQGAVTYLNAVAESLTGWSLGDAEGQPLDRVFCIVDEETREPAAKPALRALEEGGSIGLPNHTVLLAKDGRELPIDDRAAPIHDETGRLVGSVLIFRDIAERRFAELALQRSESELADFFANASVGLHWADQDGRVLRVNHAELEMLGYELAEYVGRPIADLYVDRSDFDAVWSRLGRGETIRDHPAQMRRKDGTIRDVLLSANVLFEDGEFVHTRNFTVDITERKRAEEALRASEQALRAADRRKDEFLATLAHELRNPLAPIRNALELQKLGAEDPDLQRQARDTMERQLVHMVRLVDDLLDVGRITRDRLVLQRDRVELRSILLQAVETCRSAVDRAGVSLDVSLPDHAVPLDADAVRLVQVFTNLLHNACKYTPRGGHVVVRATESDGQSIVSVEDDGIGIPRDKLEGVFEMFGQVDQTTERSRGGLGIGLTLAKRLVELHGGRLEARSDGLGHGSQFVVSLTGPSSPGRAPTEEEAGPAVSLGPLRILVVDDNPDAAQSLATLLGVLGHTTRTARDGEEALKAAACFRPQVVLLDLGLPKMSGYETCRRLRTGVGGAEAVIVALTGWGQAQDRLKTKEAGFDDHLVKPVERTALLATLRSLLAGRVHRPPPGTQA